MFLLLTRYHYWSDNITAVTNHLQHDPIALFPEVAGPASIRDLGRISQSHHAVADIHRSSSSHCIQSESSFLCAL